MYGVGASAPNEVIVPGMFTLTWDQWEVGRRWLGAYKKIVIGHRVWICGL